MAHTKFQAEVLTPEGPVFSEEIEMLSTRHRHRLDRDPRQSRARARDAEADRAAAVPLGDSEIVRFKQSAGYLQFAENRALVLVEEATPVDGG